MKDGGLEVSDADFSTMVSAFGKYLEFSLRFMEDELENGSVDRVVDNLAQLISMGNTIGYFRGENSVLISRKGLLPANEIRTEAAKLESDFENRIHAIITKVMESDVANDYVMRLFRYFVVARSVGYSNESKLTPPIS